MAFKKTYPYQMGIGSDGKALYTMKVMINEAGEVVTAYPMR